MEPHLPTRMGDGTFAHLTRSEIIREKYPDFGVQLGMAGEFVLGMHGRLEYEGVRLAGLWPKEQLLLAQQAGATMFGPVVNVNTGKSCAWNVARAVALVKPCMEVATIPVLGKGVLMTVAIYAEAADAIVNSDRAAAVAGCRDTPQGLRHATAGPNGRIGPRGRRLPRLLDYLSAEWLTTGMPHHSETGDTVAQVCIE